MTPRAQKAAPPAWLARFAVAARRLFPNARLDADTIAELMPSLNELWVAGYRPEIAAQTLCQCQGRAIRPNPIATRQNVAAPKGAKRGQPFGVDEVRPAPAPRPRAPRKPPAPRAAACPPGSPACSLGLVGAVCGLPAVLVLAAAQGAPLPRVARYCLTSADRLIPSHQSTRAFAPDPRYPDRVQERDYQTDRAEQLKVLGMAQNLIPALVFNGAPGAIDGPPVTTSEGIVLGGNGRTMALQLHYAQGGTVPADYLADHAAQFGFTAEQVRAVDRPVVVRTIETSTDRQSLAELVRLLNVPLSQALDIRSESVAEAQRLTAEVLDVLGVALAEPETTLRDYLSSRDSRALAATLRRSGIVTDNNAKRYLSPDGFTEDGKTFVERILTAAVLDSARLIDRAGPQLVATIARSAPWILAAASGGPDWDLRPALRAAVADLVDLRNAGSPSVDFFLRQGAIEPPRVLSTPKGEPLLRLLYEQAGKPVQFARFARRYAELAAAHPSAQGGLFAAEKVDPTTALTQAINQSNVQKG